MLRGMKIAKKVREFAGLNPWEMYQRMGKKTVQAYLSLERKAKRITLEDLNALEDIYIAAGGTSDEFNALRRKCVD